MVFLSTCQVLLGYPLTRSVFAFGTRTLIPRTLVEEIAVGLLLVVPLSMVVAFATKRVAASGYGKPPYVRSDIWTTILITLVGDLFLELLLPSLQCLPMELPWEEFTLLLQPSQQPQQPWSHSAALTSYLMWLQQSWGFSCPDDMDRSDLLSTDAVGTLLTLRLLCMCLGVYVGESFCPIALTGGIACGKSTVIKLLVHPPSQQHHGSSSASSSAPSNRKSARKGGNNSSSNKTKKAKSSFLSASAQSFTSHVASTVEDEGSFWIVDTDKIAHEILLPPSVLASSSGPAYDLDDEDDEYDDDLDESDDDDDHGSSSGGGGGGGGPRSPGDKRSRRRRFHYKVSPKDSVYHTILRTFANDHDDGNHHGGGRRHRHFLLASNNYLIDRDKLGALVFADRSLRQQLNRITHPRIFAVMMKQILQGIYASSYDIVCADIPLLFESMGSLRYMFGLVIVVACSKEHQFQRLKHRNPELSEAQCWDRIHAQLPVSQKVQRADLVIVNDGSLSDLAHDVEEVRREVMGRLFGVGMSLLQMLLLVGGSLSLAVSSKLFTSWTG